MEEQDMLRRFLRTDSEGHVWYACLPKQCDDTILTAVTELPNLTYLEAGGTKITDAGVEELAAIKSLEVLHLWNTAVTDSGLEPLKKLNELRVLSLGGTSVDDSGISQLVDLKNLEELRLNGTRVTDAVVEHLKKLPKLQKVWLQNTKLTPQAVDELRQAFTEEEPRSATTKTLRTQIVVYHSPKHEEESPSNSDAETPE
jgi:Leucine-rich repeat (LRR) protein